eukprot:scaffold13610_cov159-Ochromonas_danica.AAC.4
MAKKQQLFLSELWGKADKDVFKIFAKNLNERQGRIDKSLKSKAMEIWQNYTIERRKIMQEEEQCRRTIDVLKNSTRGNRSTMEKEILRRRSIIFLQGDFGNVYYMIAKGRVGLYLEPSKDREMIIAREFGHLRGQPFTGVEEDYKKLGNLIFNLNAGSGFGEYAILATTNKIRSCAVIAIDDDSMLLVMHADTYNAVLRQHHYRQKQLSSATSLLQELPLFRHNIYSKIASIAYTMRSQTYSSGSLLVKVGDPINNVLLIASGQVKVYAPPGGDGVTEEAGQGNQVMKRLPRLAVAVLGRGQIIGEAELHKGLRTFLMTYETAAASTEILEMPSTVFKEALDSGDFRNSVVYRSIEMVVEEKELRRTGRISRAYDAMKKMVEGRTKVLKAKEEIMNILPGLLDTSYSSPPLTSISASPKGSSTATNRTPSISRASSIRMETANTLPTTAVASVPSTPRKASSFRSPRTLSFTSPLVNT